MSHIHILERIQALPLLQWVSLSQIFSIWWLLASCVPSQVRAFHHLDKALRVYSSQGLWALYSTVVDILYCWVGLGCSFPGLARSHQVCRPSMCSSTQAGIDSRPVQILGGSPERPLHWRHDQVHLLLWIFFSLEVTWWWVAEWSIIFFSWEIILQQSLTVVMIYLWSW
jgi:hypothetical protein